MEAEGSRSGFVENGGAGGSCLGEWNALKSSRVGRKLGSFDSDAGRIAPELFTPYKNGGLLGLIL